jgi:hypothetical protein
MLHRLAFFLNYDSEEYMTHDLSIKGNNGAVSHPIKRKPPISVSSGSWSQDFTDELHSQATRHFFSLPDKQHNVDQKMNATFDAMAGIAPKDEVEGMFAAQIVACHNAAMECFHRAMLYQQPSEFREQNLNQANKLTRTFATLISALGNYRGKGVTEQKVTVQHVHVSDGGQAIVGNVAKSE